MWLMANKRGNEKLAAKKAKKFENKAASKRKAKKYNHAYARDLLREYYEDPSTRNLEAVMAEFEKMIEAVMYRHRFYQFNEADDYRQACRIRLWKMISTRKIDPDDAFGAYLNRAFLRAVWQEAKVLYRQQFKSDTGEARTAFGWRPEVSSDPVEIAEAREILAYAQDFCEEWGDLFRFPWYRDVYSAVVEYYFALGEWPHINDVVSFDKHANPDDRLEAKFVFTAAVIHLRFALQVTKDGERRFHEK
jgi:hypothetical protein